MAEKLKLDLSLVLQNIPSERVACAARLIALLLAEGLEKVHLVHEDGSAHLCLHYDSQRFSVSRMRENTQQRFSDVTHRRLSRGFSNGLS